MLCYAVGRTLTSDNVSLELVKLNAEETEQLNTLLADPTIQQRLNMVSTVINTTRSVKYSKSLDQELGGIGTK